MNSPVLINPSMYHIRKLENLLAVKKSVIVSFLDRITGAFTSRLNGSTDAIHAHACTADCSRQLRTRRALIVRD